MVNTINGSRELLIESAMADILDVASLFDSIAFGYIPRDLYVVVHHQGTVSLRRGEACQIVI